MHENTQRKPKVTDTADTVQYQINICSQWSSFSALEHLNIVLISFEELVENIPKQTVCEETCWAQRDEEGDPCC